MSAAYSGQVHPLAEHWPMLDDDELHEIATSIREVGLLEPIVVTPDGLIADGRNRLRACELAEIEPTFVTDPTLVDDGSVAAFVQARNAERRHLTTGQQAMGRALMLAAQGRRKGGRWERGSIVGNGQSPITATDQDYLKKAGLILDTAERAAALGPDFVGYVDLPARVMNGGASLDLAYKTALEFDGRAQMAESRKRQPLAEALTYLDVLLDDTEKRVPLPVLPVAITRSDRQRIGELARRFKAAAAALTTYAKEAP